MEVRKKVEIIVETTDSKPVNTGDVMAFSCGGGELIGAYVGIDSRGNWKFKGVNQFENVCFSVAPRSIEKMYHFTDVFKEAFPMNLPVEECED